MQTMRDFEVYGVARERLADWIWSKYAHADPVRQLAACTACGHCESKCPQHLEIVAAIKRGREALAARCAVGTAPDQPIHRKPQGNPTP
jgi:heterodisulfide reductase subunit C